jgi:hypothetical protein
MNRQNRRRGTQLKGCTAVPGRSRRRTKPPGLKKGGAATNSSSGYRTWKGLPTRTDEPSLTCVAHFQPHSPCPILGYNRGAHRCGRWCGSMAFVWPHYLPGCETLGDPAQDAPKPVPTHHQDGLQSSPPLRMAATTTTEASALALARGFAGDVVPCGGLTVLVRRSASILKYSFMMRELCARTGNPAPAPSWGTTGASSHPKA